MGSYKNEPTRLSKPKSRPPESDEGREQHCINLAYERAEQQLIDGTASSQVITHFLKLATAKEQLELEKLRNESLLIQQKVETLKAQATSKELYEDAIAAFSIYAGKNDE